MSGTPIKVAVVGHTNTGKTSLLRTLTRDVDFGDVSDHPAVTRHVEGTALLVEGEAVLELYDTPGLEDSIGLLEHLDGLGGTDHVDRSKWIGVIDGFLESPAAKGEYAQEAKVLRQLLRSDIALYVIDARDRVLGKHRDELEILARCARPVVPVLNFTASDNAQTAVWREHLSRVGMHAVSEFDTVVYDQQGERRLYEKMQTLLDTRGGALTSLIDDRGRQRDRLVSTAARMLADMLLDAAAAVVIVPGDDVEAERRGVETLKQAVRDREERCLRLLLELFRFRPEDGRLGDLQVDDGRWGIDLFSPAAMKQFGVRAGGAAAAGAMAGLAVDAATGGITFGVFAATGAAVGALYQAGRSYGRRIVDRARGRRELRCDDHTLQLLLTRQVALVKALLQRGHAAFDPVVVPVGGGRATWPGATRPEELDRARVNPADRNRRARAGGGGAVAGGADRADALDPRVVSGIKSGPARRWQARRWQARWWLARW
jgi:hypothetical protein